LAGAETFVNLFGRGRVFPRRLIGTAHIL